MVTKEPVARSSPAAPSLRELAAEEAVPLFRFDFQRRYNSLYSTGNHKFVLRDEHVEELKRVVRKQNAERPPRLDPLTMSDIVNAALDFAFEHPAAFNSHVDPSRLSESLGREVYRRAMVHFIHHEMV